MYKVKELQVNMQPNMLYVHKLYEVTYEYDPDHVYVVHEDVSILAYIKHRRTLENPITVFGAAMKSSDDSIKLHVARIPSADYFAHTLMGDTETSDYFGEDDNGDYVYNVTRICCSSYETRYIIPRKTTYGIRKGVRDSCTFANYVKTCSEMRKYGTPAREVYPL